MSDSPNLDLVFDPAETERIADETISGPRPMEMDRTRTRAGESFPDETRSFVRRVLSSVLSSALERS